MKTIILLFIISAFMAYSNRNVEKSSKNLLCKDSVIVRTIYKSKPITTEERLKLRIVESVSVSDLLRITNWNKRKFQESDSDFVAVCNSDTLTYHNVKSKCCGLQRKCYHRQNITYPITKCKNCFKR